MKQMELAHKLVCECCRWWSVQVGKEQAKTRRAELALTHLRTAVIDAADDMTCVDDSFAELPQHDVGECAKCDLLREADL